MWTQKKLIFGIAIQFSVSSEFFQNNRVSLLCAVWPQDWPQDFLPNPLITTGTSCLHSQLFNDFVLATGRVCSPSVNGRKKNWFLDRDPIFNEFVTVNGPIDAGKIPQFASNSFLDTQGNKSNEGYRGHDLKCTFDWHFKMPLKNYSLALPTWTFLVPFLDIPIYAVLKPQDSFGRFVKMFLDLQKVDHTIRKHQ